MKNKLNSNINLEAMPTGTYQKGEADKVGKWVLAHQGTIAEGWYCSVCGKHGYKTAFCPECGSKNT